MIYDTLENRRYVTKYDTDAAIPESLINTLLMQAWKVTPSKNNFMPYTIHVVGPKDQKYKELVYLNAASNEGRKDDVIDPLSSRYSPSYLPNYANILSCSYLLVFTMRLEDDPNPFQQMLINRGHNYEAVDETKLNDMYSTASFECGLFADTLSALCLEHNIDSSFTGCFHRNVNMWENIPFVTRKPIMLMTLGKGKVYRQDTISGSIEELDLKPDYYKIVNFVK